MTHVSVKLNRRDYVLLIKLAVNVNTQNGTKEVLLPLPLFISPSGFSQSQYL
jgi:hypothetical protein